VVEVVGEGRQSRPRQKFDNGAHPRQSTLSKELQEHNIDKGKERRMLKRYDTKNSHNYSLRWLKTVYRNKILMCHYNSSLSLDATVMVSKNCFIISEHVVIICVTR